MKSSSCSRTSLVLGKVRNFQYYWDYGNWPTEPDMGIPADLTKLHARVHRGNALLDKAAKSGDRADSIMSNFEQTMNRYDAHFGSIEDQDKQLGAILTAMGGNGGPSLDATFPSSQGATTPVAARPIDNATGDPLKPL